MAKMPNSLGRFKAVLGAGWILLGLGAVIYARMKGIPMWAALPVAAAFLIEFSFYLFPGFDAPREWLGHFSKEVTAALITLSAALPYLAYSVPTGLFKPMGLVMVLLVAGTVAFWYILAPVSAVTDAIFLIIPAAVLLERIFRILYPSPITKVDLSVLGQLMLIHTAALSLFLIRGNAGVEFRFWPERREWFAGLKYFAMLIPCAGLAYWALGLVKLRPHPLNVFLALGTFFGILWVTALSEEFAFRGLLQPWSEKWTGSFPVALVFTSLVFGSIHLSFGHVFPNWKFAIVAAIAGLFYGLARRSTQSIQSGMVAHALTVTLWRVFFV
jgi:membrane protease YdiL (CAAX protease family)